MPRSTEALRNAIVRGDGSTALLTATHDRAGHRTRPLVNFLSPSRLEIKGQAPPAVSDGCFPREASGAYSEFLRSIKVLAACA